MGGKRMETASHTPFAERCLREAECLADELAARGARGRALAVVLGSGLGGVAERLEERVVIPAAELAHLPRARVAGHEGSVVLGSLGGIPLIVQKGRVHLYEGWNPFAATRTMRAFAQLGLRAVLLVNACGALVPEWPRGTLVRLVDHLNLQGRSPLFRGEAARASPYDRGLGQALDRAAARAGIELRRGVYAGCLGPSYETPAEIRALRALGAHVVGMSTVAEASAAFACGLRVAAIACVANPAAGLSSEPLRHEDVVEGVSTAEEPLARLLELAAPELVKSVTS